MVGGELGGVCRCLRWWGVDCECMGGELVVGCCLRVFVVFSMLKEAVRREAKVEDAVMT